MEEQIITNKLIKQIPDSNFSVFFKQTLQESGISFVHAKFEYVPYSSDTDIFCYLTKNALDSIKNNSHVFFLFDVSVEGYCPFNKNFFSMLYYNCEKYNVSPKKVLFVSSNVMDYKNIKIYNKKNKIKQSLNVYVFMHFKFALTHMIENHFKDSCPEIVFKNTKKENFRYFKTKYFLSLSRKNRRDRSYACYKLWENNLLSKGILSHDKMTPFELESLRKTYKLSVTKLLEWSETLPLIADTEDFVTNHALKIHSHLHYRTLFQIVNETETDNCNGHCLFFSEKTFRPIAHMQPFLIWGQQHCNKRLQEYGYQLYDEIFDYSFDTIEDPADRYSALLTNISNTVSILNKMTRDEKIRWRWQLKEKLIHNYKVLMSTSSDKKSIKKLEKQLLNI
jgi:hypothetical protein